MLRLLINGDCHSIVVLSMIAFFLYGCGANNSLNTAEIENYNEDGVLKQEYLEDFYCSEAPSSIRFYIESSGSMNGLFRSYRNTGFKHDISAILLDSEIGNNIDSVAVFGNDAEIAGLYSATDFRQKMNGGEFEKQASTKVPDMLERIVQDMEQSLCDVAVFISDMKYSPVGINFDIAMGHYELDVEKVFSSIPDKSVSLISCESDYVSTGGTVLCEEFPYYYTIIGDASKVAWLRNKVISTLEKFGKNLSCNDFSVEYGCPRYAALPSTAVNMVRNNYEFLNGFSYEEHCSSFTNYSNDIMPAEVIIGANYRHLPDNILQELTGSDFEISSYRGGASASISVLNDYSPSADVDIVDNVQPNVFLKLTIQGLGGYDCDMLKINLHKEVAFDTRISKYYGATKESELNKTVSIEKFIEGLSNAYPEPLVVQDAPMTIFVTNKNI